MESYDVAGAESYLHKARESEESSSNALEAKMAELDKTKEELKRAKDSATQSWLDSKPLIDELEKLQSELARAKDQSSMSGIIISELESQLETTNMCIRSKKEEELKGRKLIDKITQASDQTREEMEKLKMETDEERRARSKLKQVLRLRRQTLRTLQLRLRAIRIESEAYGTSAAKALRYINHTEMDNNTVQLTHEDYCALTRRAKEETAHADWRVSVSIEQRLIAEASRDSALRRLKEFYSDNRPRTRVMKEEKTMGEGKILREEEEQDPRIRTGIQDNNRERAFHKAQTSAVPESDWRNPQQQFRRSKSNNNKRLVKQKKPSILSQIKIFLVRNITRMFG